MRFFGQSLLDALSSTISGNLQRRLIEYVLGRLLGSYVKNEISQESIQLQLRDGRLSFTNLELQTEPFNDKLKSFGLILVRGTVELLEIQIPWSDLLRGKVKILAHGLSLVLCPSSTRHAWADTAETLDDSLTESITNVADSFLAETKADDLGVADDMPESAVLQKTIDVILANLTIELSDTSVKLSDGSAESVVLDCAYFSMSPNNDGLSKELSSQGFNLSIITQPSEDDPSGKDAARRPSSSHSTSSSSYDDAELMQSTIFDTEQSRSLFMSAVSFQEDADTESNQDAREEHAEASCSRKPLLSSSAFNGLLSGGGNLGMILEMSCSSIKICMGRAELLFLARFMKGFATIDQIHEQEPTSKTSTKPVLELQLRFSSIVCKMDLLRQLNLASFDNHETDATHLSATIHRVAIRSASGRVNGIDFDSFLLNMGGSMIQALPTSKTCSYRSSRLQPSKLDLSQVSVVLQPDSFRRLQDSLQSLVSQINSIYASPRATQAPPRETLLNENLQHVMTVNCPRIDVRSRLESSELTLSCTEPVLQYSMSESRTRVSLTFADISLAIQRLDILHVSSDELPCAIDLTITHRKVPQPVLEFVNYEELFEHPERDHKTEVNTLRAVKQKSKEITDFTLRGSFGRVSSEWDVNKIRLARDLLSMQTSHPGNVVGDHGSASKATATILVEISQIAVKLGCRESELSLDLGKGSFFAVQNLKGVAIFTVDFTKLELGSHDSAGKLTRIIHPSLHIEYGAMNEKAVFTVRYRRNLVGRRNGQSKIRLGLINLQAEYSPEMTWLQDAMTLFAEISTQKSATDSDATSLAPEFAVDVTNTSIGLNPFTGKSKGILYLRRSVFQGVTSKQSRTTSINMHAGVIELFLIDNIDHGHCGAGIDKRMRNDAIATSLARLGFVKVLSAETVEIAFRVEHDPHGRVYSTLDVVGAIVTITTCADSMATLVALFNLLRLPVVISDEVKYKLGLTSDGEIPLDIFAEIEENSFASIKNKQESDRELDSARGTSADDFPTASELCGAAVMPQEDQEETLINVAGENMLVRESVATVVDEYFMTQSLAYAPSSGIRRIKEKIFTLIARKCFIVWNLHDGYDWQNTRDQISQAVERALEKSQGRTSDSELDRRASQPDVGNDDDSGDDLEESTEVGDLLFNSIYIALPDDAKAEDVKRSINEAIAQADASDTATQTTVTQARQSKPSISFETESLQLGRSRMHKVRIEISSFDVDLDYYDAIEGEVQSNIKLSIHDLEIIDNVSTSTWRKFLTYHRGAGRRDAEGSMAQMTITGVKPVAGLAAAELAIEAQICPLRLHVDQDTLEFLTRFFEFKDPEASIQNLPAEELFIQRFELQAIPIQIDYKPKRVDLKSLRSGRTTELKNIFILEDSNMTLKHVILYGVCGLARVFQQLNDIWLAHIKSKQLPTVLAGVSPIRSLASFGSGFRNLVALPVSEYRKDGRIIPGLTKGLGAFVRTTGTEAIRLGAKLAVGTQGILENAEHTLSDSKPTAARTNSSHAISMYADQPQNLKQGLSQAVGGMSKHVAVAKDALTAMPRNLEEENDARGMARVAAKTVPIAILRPLIGTTEMISKTLLGLRNTMNPEQKQLNDDKYKHAE